MPRILFVSGFHPATRARDLAYEFERFGPLVRCDVPAPRNPHAASNPYAFVEFRSTRDAEDAYHDMHGRYFEGSRLSIQWAKNPPSSVWRYDRRSPPRRTRSRSPLPPPPPHPLRRRDDRDYDRDRDLRDRERDYERDRDLRERDRDYDRDRDLRERDRDYDRDRRRGRSRSPVGRRSLSPHRGGPPPPPLGRFDDRDRRFDERDRRYDDRRPVADDRDKRYDDSRRSGVDDRDRRRDDRARTPPPVTAVAGDIGAGSNGHGGPDAGNGNGDLAHTPPYDR